MSEIPTAPQSRRAGCLTLSIVFVVLAMLFCGTPLGLFFSWRMQQRSLFRKEIEAIRARGEPTNVVELEQYYRLDDGVEDVTKLWQEAAAEFASPGVGKEAAGLPFLGTEGKSEPKPDQAWEELEAAQAFLLNHAAAYAKLHAATEKGGAARYPTDFSRGFAMLMPDVQNTRAAARALQLESYVRIHEKDPAGYIRCVNALVALSKSLDRYPILVSQLVRVAIAALPAQSAADALPHLTFTADQLDQLEAAFEALKAQGTLKSALIGERVMGSTAMAGPIDPSLTGDSPMPSIPLRDADRVFFLQMMRDYIEAAEQPWPEALERSRAISLATKQTINQSGLARFKYTLSALVSPAHDVSFEAAARSEAIRRIVLTALAVEKQRLRTGAFPTTLDFLPEESKENATDPFTGRPLKFVHTETGYRIYSVGKDMKDDGGAGGLTGQPDLAIER